GGKDPVVAGVRALVTEVLAPAREYERAVESALGDKVQYLVVDGQLAGVSALDYLKTHAGGRGGFVPGAPRTGADVQALDYPAGVCGPAQRFVTVTAGYEAVVEYLLGDVLIVDSLDAGVALWKQAASDARLAGKRFVTKDGEVIDAAGAMTGGSGE